MARKVTMHWTLHEPTIYKALFWGLTAFGVLIATVAYGLMGRPFSKGAKGRPVLGLFCALIFGGSFCLLGYQMVAGRFYALSLEPGQLELTMVNEHAVSLRREEVAQFGMSEEKGASYIMITTFDGDYYRGGPCAETGGDLGEHIRKWMDLPELVGP